VTRTSVSIGTIVGVFLAGQIVFTPGSGSASSPVWSITSSRPSVSQDFYGVSCVSATSCEAVGMNGNNTGTSQPLAESWNGQAWSIVPSPGPSGSKLSSVSCVSPVWCQAVGFSASGAAALIESWHGHGWSAVPSPSAATGTLSDVSCVSRTFCIAVGGRFTGTLIEMWNGHAWIIVSSPNLTDVVYGTLDGVSCVSRRACMAVGIYLRQASDGTEVLGQFIESWNGKAWSITPSPLTEPGADISRLFGVSCVSVTACVAVGLFEGPGSPRLVARTFTERWNGKVWSVLPTPNRGVFNELDRVSCVSAIFCQAVGVDTPLEATTTIEQLIESWNGHTWSIVPNSSPASTNSVLNDVSCVSATSCKAVGDGQLIESYG